MIVLFQYMGYVVWNYNERTCLPRGRNNVFRRANNESELAEEEYEEIHDKIARLDDQ